MQCCRRVTTGFLASWALCCLSTSEPGSCCLFLRALFDRSLLLRAFWQALQAVVAEILSTGSCRHCESLSLAWVRANCWCVDIDLFIAGQVMPRFGTQMPSMRKALSCTVRANSMSPLWRCGSLAHRKHRRPWKLS